MNSKKRDRIALRGGEWHAMRMEAFKEVQKIAASGELLPSTDFDALYKTLDVLINGTPVEQGAALRTPDDDINDAIDQGDPTWK